MKSNRRQLAWAVVLPLAVLWNLSTIAQGWYEWFVAVATFVIVAAMAGAQYFTEKFLNEVIEKHDDLGKLCDDILDNNDDLLTDNKELIEVNAVLTKALRGVVASLGEK